MKDLRVSQQASKRASERASERRLSAGDRWMCVGISISGARDHWCYCCCYCGGSDIFHGWLDARGWRAGHGRSRREGAADREDGRTDGRGQSYCSDASVSGRTRRSSIRPTSQMNNVLICIAVYTRRRLIHYWTATNNMSDVVSRYQ